MRRELLFANVMASFFTNTIGYIFIVRRLGKQSKLMCPYQTLSLTQSELNLRIHGPYGPNAHAGADLQAFLIFCFKPILILAHKLSLLIYGDNKYPDIFFENIKVLTTLKWAPTFSSICYEQVALLHPLLPSIYGPKARWA